MRTNFLPILMMGGSFYDGGARFSRAAASGYKTKSVDEIFTQQKERKVHAEMDPRNFKIRESRDSVNHPFTIPIILALDETGSMGHIPHDLIKDGLPKLMSNLIDKGAKDAAVCFVGVGDHEADRYPLQCGQFESGDAELDLWLTRTYLEGNGGGNAGESYGLAWYFAAKRTVTDAFEKRGKKGFLFTVGDEPNLLSYPCSAITQITGDPCQATLSADQLLTESQKTYNVYHIEVGRSGNRSSARSQWKQKLGDNCIFVDDYTTVPDVIADIVIKNSDLTGYPTTVTHDPTDDAGDDSSSLTGDIKVTL